MSDDLETLRHQLHEARAEAALLRSRAVVICGIPDDCQGLMAEVLPSLIRVMRGGSNTREPFHWRDKATRDEHLAHAEAHHDEASSHRPIDESDGEPHRAHEIVRLMMVYFHELKG